jgi:hypothetical protein
LRRCGKNKIIELEQGPGYKMLNIVPSFIECVAGPKIKVLLHDEEIKRGHNEINSIIYHTALQCARFIFIFSEQ